MEHAATAPVLVLSPHLDDAVLSAWSVLGGDEDVLVVNVYAGVPDPGPPPRWDALAGATDRRDLMEARLEEDRAALALAGRSAVYLPFLDRHYRDGGAPDVTEVAAAIQSAARAASMIYAPGGIGGHADHLLVRDAALALGGSHGFAVRIYAELPYAVRFGWPGWVTGQPPGPADADWDHWLRDAPTQPSRESGEARRLSDEEMSAKIAAMRRYRSQFPLLNQGAIGLLEHPAVLPWEVAWNAGLSAGA